MLTRGSPSLKKDDANIKRDDARVKTKRSDRPAGDVNGSAVDAPAAPRQGTSPATERAAHPSHGKGTGERKQPARVPPLQGADPKQPPAAHAAEDAQPSMTADDRPMMRVDARASKKDGVPTREREDAFERVMALLPPKTKKEAARLKHRYLFVLGLKYRDISKRTQQDYARKLRLLHSAAGYEKDDPQTPAIADVIEQVSGTPRSFNAYRAAANRAARAALVGPDSDLQRLARRDQTLSKKDAAHALKRVVNALKIIDRYPPDPEGNARSRVAEGRKAPTLRRGGGLARLSRSNAKRAGVGLLNGSFPQWTNTFFMQGVEHLIKTTARKANENWPGVIHLHNKHGQNEFMRALAVTMAVGLRPSELEKGVVVSYDKDAGRLHFAIRGTKVSETTGMELRELAVDPNVTLATATKRAKARAETEEDKKGQLKVRQRAELAYLAGQCEEFGDGGSLTVGIPNWCPEDPEKARRIWRHRFNAVGEATTTQLLASKDAQGVDRSSATKIRNYNITPYTFRHLFSSRVKNDAAAARGEGDPAGYELAPAALGHASNRTQQHYGVRKQAAGSSSGVKAVKTSRPVRTHKIDGYKSAATRQPRA